MVAAVEATDPVVAASAVGSVCWAMAAVWAAVTSLRWRSIRRTVWPAVIVPEAVLAGWWAWLNVRRWASVSYTTAEYRADIYPIVPVLFVVMTLNLVVWVGRARRTEHITRVIERQKVTTGDG